MIFKKELECGCKKFFITMKGGCHGYSSLNWKMRQDGR
jgi:hypothetical protein